jgi:dTDP-glucose 4,6-dehydratase
MANARAKWKRRALVTGGAGFVGSHLCERLLSEGYSVVCMANLRTGLLENIAHLLEGGGSESDFEFIEHDVTTHVSIGGN